MSGHSEASNSSTNGAKKPVDSAFKQQRLPAWQPILTAGTVLPAFFVIGMVFVPVGVGLLHLSNSVEEKVLDYTECNSTQTSADGTMLPCSQIKEMNIQSSCFCQLPFTIDNDWKGAVYMYYGLTNFYQNHRRYVKSRDDNQLLGTDVRTVSTDCVPYAKFSDRSTRNGTEIPIAPCGAIANSLFNDTFKLTYKPAKQGVVTDVPVKLSKTGIAWQSDKNVKFRNPGGRNEVGDLKVAFQGTHKPLYWKREIWELDPSDPMNNGLENEDLIVWMRTAAFPTFRKLYGIIDSSEENFKNGLPKGNYVLDVEYNFPVVEFDGTKAVILSTTSLLGGKNPFLGIAYIVVGSLCLAMGVAFLFIHIKSGMSTKETISVDPHTPYQ